LVHVSAQEHLTNLHGDGGRCVRLQSGIQEERSVAFTIAQTTIDVCSHCSPSRGCNSRLVANSIVLTDCMASI